MDLAGTSLPAGTLIMVSPLLVHHRADLYASPGAFLPDRFLGQGTSGPPEHWIPFGGGRRHCLGAELAMLEMAIVLTRMMTAVALSPANRRPEAARLAGTVLVPARHAMVVVSRPGPAAA